MESDIVKAFCWGDDTSPTRGGEWRRGVVGGFRGYSGELRSYRNVTHDVKGDVANFMNFLIKAA